MSEGNGFGLRLAEVADAATVGALLFDFNTEFESPTPSAAEFAERFTRLLLRDDVLVVLAEAVAAARTRGMIEMHINVDEIDVDTRRFYERHGFVNILPGESHRMLCYLREF